MAPVQLSHVSSGCELCTVQQEVSLEESFVQIAEESQKINNCILFRFVDAIDYIYVIVQQIFVLRLQ